MGPLSALAEPLPIGGRRMRNRFVFAPMSVSYADRAGQFTTRSVEHYARRAQGGAAMVITENIAISEAGRQLPLQPVADDERCLAGMSRVAQAIQAGGALAVAQLVHSGRYAGPWDEYAARRRLAPSAVAFELRPGEWVTPAAISLAEIAEIVDEFARATALAVRAGFDGVEIHGAQGFLISSFQSPRMNRRDDEYGSDRSRFAREVIAAVRGVGPDHLVGLHLMSDEMMDGGWTSADAREFLAGLPKDGLDFVVPIPTTFESMRNKLATGVMNATRYSAEVGEAMAGATTAKIFANGGLGSAAAAESALASPGVDAVVLARALLCDPDLPWKVLSGREDEVRVCACSPPLCLQTQLEGTVCAGWPDEVRARGYRGLRTPEQGRQLATANARRPRAVSTSDIYQPAHKERTCRT
jgi:2,4-dienoyl-CoA reductase (NADPH2)